MAPARARPTEFARTDKGGSRLDVFERLFDLIDELGAEFVTDPPCQPTLARAALRQYDRKLGRNVDMFGDDLHAAGRYIGDGAVAWQRTRAELDLREISALAAFALTSIH
jgi:hypothetical protein